MADRPRVLCLDDEPQVLEALKDRLRRRFDVVTTTNGFEALKLLASEPFPVVVSDMRMPLLDGNRFLTLARRHAPDTVRIVLTGQADVRAAVDAVNDGEVFRFLVKPADQRTLVAALEAGVDLHRLRTGERVLLEETLRGAIATMVEVLTMAHPAAFGRATRIREHVLAIAACAGVEVGWEVTSAALLSQIGALTLGDDAVETLPLMAEHLLAHIPRLEHVRALLRHAGPAPAAGPAAGGSLEANLLRVAVDYELLESEEIEPQVALATMRSRHDRYDPALLDALTDALGEHAATRSLREVAVADLVDGMTLATDIKSVTGQLLVARGAPATAWLRARLRALPAGHVHEPVKVWLRSDEAD